MDRRTTLGTALLVLAVACVTVPPLVPVEQVLVHDTRPLTTDGKDRIEAQGYEIYSYENLSERGKELYVRTLESGGVYTVAVGEGAPEFEYLTASERADARREHPRRRPGHIVIERPGDADLPPADEPPHGEAEGERWEEAQRYELMAVSEDTPPVDAAPQLLRLAAVVVGILSAGVGGYLVTSTSAPHG